MKKIILIITAILLIAFAVPAFAAVKDNSKIADLRNQMHNLRVQMIDEQVKAGQLTDSQAKAIKDRMETNFKARQDAGFVPGTCGAGMMGKRGYGRGMMGGYGRIAQ